MIWTILSIAVGVVVGAVAWMGLDVKQINQVTKSFMPDVDDYWRGW